MTQDAKDILAMRALFWQKFRGEITQVELEAKTAEIMSRQKGLPFSSQMPPRSPQINSKALLGQR